MKKVVCLGLAGVLSIGAFSMAAIPTDSVVGKILPSAIYQEVALAAETNVKVPAKEVKNKSEILEENLKIPVIEGSKNQEVQKKINTRFEKKVMDFRNEVEKWAKEYAEDAKKEGWEIRPYTAMVDYKVTHNKDNLLSITLNYYEYTGGAHGNTLQQTSNIDLNTGYEAKLKDIFKKGYDYKTVINEEIKKQMKTDGKVYFEEEWGAFESIENDQSFYIENGNIVVYFQHYEIAPYVAGIPEFKIPFTWFKDNMKKTIEVKRAVDIETKQVYDNTQTIEENLKIPVLTYFKDQQIQQNINSQFEKEAVGFAAEIDQLAKEFAEEVKKEGWEVKQYQATSEYTVHTNQKDFLSVTVNYYEYTGGAHGNYNQVPYNIDLKTGKEVAVKDIFKEGTDYKTIINEEIAKQNKESNKGYEFTTIADDQAFL
jgi:flagellar biosynthesis/type III secretory pathway protein FliH